METDIFDEVHKLRHKLHELAERSGEEKNTKQCLIDFLKARTSLRIDDFGHWFCAVHEESEAAETVAFRADMDALPYGEAAAHLCGHDGHSAMLCGLGLMLEKQQLGRNIVLIFQHAEENGKGGKECAGALVKYKVDRVYAIHNVPEWPENAVLFRTNTFACSSRGMTISFEGKPTHAAYPENGINPGFAAARLVCALPEITDDSIYSGLTMATLIGGDIGEKAFGSAAANAELWLTLRAWNNTDIEALTDRIMDRADREAAADEVKTSFSFTEGFPATVNDNQTLERVRKICAEADLECIDVPEPFRWSEDFGYYGASAKAVMLGVGAGISWPQLHTADYVFNDDIIPTVLKLFSSLAQFG